MPIIINKKSRNLPGNAVLILFCIAITAISATGQIADSTEIVIAESLIENSDQDTTQGEKADALAFPFAENSRLNFAGLLAKTLGYFMLIVFLIVVSVYLLRKFVYNKRDSNSSGSAIHILNSTYVGPKKSLLLVEAAGKILVLSSTDSQMNLITELKKEEYEEYIQGDRRAPEKALRPPGSQFGEILRKFLKRAK